MQYFCSTFRLYVFSSFSTAVSCYGAFKYEEQGRDNRAQFTQLNAKGFFYLFFCYMKLEHYL